MYKLDYRNTEEIRKELRNMWELLVMAQKETGCNKTGKYLKQKIREYNSYYDKALSEPNWFWTDPEYYESRTMMFMLEGIFSEEEKKEYIESEWKHWYNPYNDGRDCTGVWFTTSIKLIDCGDHTVVIHHQSQDV